MALWKNPVLYFAHCMEESCLHADPVEFGSRKKQEDWANMHIRHTGHTVELMSKVFWGKDKT